jgi:hypothetical protein
MSFTIHRGIEDISSDSEKQRERYLRRVQEREERLSALEEVWSSMEVSEYVDDYEAEEEEVVAGRWTSTTNTATKIEDNGVAFAIELVKKVQANFPKRLLCGSLALLLYGVMPPRKINDLDFVILEKNVKEGEVISLKCASPTEHCLFLSSDVKYGKEINGIHLQDLDQIVYWKKKYHRPKDMKDLETYFKNQFITLEDIRL